MKSPLAHMAHDLQRLHHRSPDEDARTRWLRAKGMTVTPEQVRALRQARAAGRKLRELAEEFGLSKAGAWSICSGRTRREVAA